MSGQEDACRHRNQVAGGLAGIGVVSQRRDRLGEDGSAKGGVCIGRVGVENTIPGTGIKLANDALGESHLGVVCLRARREDWHRKSAYVCRDMSRRSSRVVATPRQQRRDQKREGKEALHAVAFIVASRPIGQTGERAHQIAHRSIGTLHAD